MKCDQENGEMNGGEKKKWIKKWKEFKENIGDTEKKVVKKLRTKWRKRNESNVWKRSIKTIRAKQWRGNAPKL